MLMVGDAHPWLSPNVKLIKEHMNIEARLSLVQQKYTELFSICDPSLVSDIRPIKSQKSRYKELLKNIKNHIDVIESEFKKGVLEDASVQRDIPRDTLEFYKEKVMPNLAAIDNAFETVDPDLAALFRLFDGVLAPHGAGGKVRFTYEVAMEKMEELVDDNPHLADSFSVAMANDVLESKLIDFEPDEWLDNARELYPVRTSRKGADIPIHAKYRIIEIYRSYVFGNWLSVLVLSRSVLEYVILDNLHKFKISPLNESTMHTGEQKPKKLSHLIEEVGEKLPAILESMEQIRRYGNEYIHPKKTKSSKESLFQRKEKAKDCLHHLRAAVEILYLEDAAKVEGENIGHF